MSQLKPLSSESSEADGQPFAPLQRWKLLRRVICGAVLVKGCLCVRSITDHVPLFWGYKLCLLSFFFFNVSLSVLVIYVFNSCSISFASASAMWKE